MPIGAYGDIIAKFGERFRFAFVIRVLPILPRYYCFAIWNQGCCAGRFGSRAKLYVFDTHSPDDATMRGEPDFPISRVYYGEL